MKKSGKIIKIHNRKRRKWLPFLLGALALLAVFAILIAINISDEFHTYHSSQATEFDTSAVEQNGLLLTTSVKKLLGKTYAGFTVSDSATGELLYQCPDLYLVKELKSIGWEADAYSIRVTQKDGSFVTYSWAGTEWQKR